MSDICADYFCGVCQVEMEISVGIAWRMILGCAECRINCAETRRVCRVFKVTDDIPAMAASHVMGEVIMAHALNNSLALSNGNVVVGGMINYGIYREDRDDPEKSYVEEALRLLNHNVSVWKEPILRSMVNAYCVPLSVLCRRMRVTVPVAKVILMMVGHGFAKESEVKDELDAIVYAVKWDEMLRVE